MIFNRYFEASLVASDIVRFAHHCYKGGACFAGQRLFFSVRVLYVYCYLSKLFYASFTRIRLRISILIELCLVEAADGVQRGRGVPVLAADTSAPDRGPSVDTLGCHRRRTNSGTGSNFYDDYASVLVNQ